MKKLIKHIFIIYFAIFLNCILFVFLYPVFTSSSIVLPFSLNSFDIAKIYPSFWCKLKIIYIVSSIISFYLIVNFIWSIFYSFFILHSKTRVHSSQNMSILNDSPSVFIGSTESDESISIPLLGLYQNILVTGSIGSGKTSSLLYPLTSQLLKLSFDNIHSSAFLILDVKGNYHKFIKSFCISNHHLSDLFIISLNGDITYNPLDKPKLKPHILANRLKNILLLFSPEQTESFWIDKAEQILTEAIRLCRLYNDNYVTFIEIHKIVMSKSYYQEKVDYLKNKFYSNQLSKNEISDFLFSLSFFDDEFFSLDDRSQAILKSEISRITNVFVSDIDIARVFCPEKSQVSFPGFSYILKNKKIVVLDMNLAEYSSLSKIIAAYLKIDFQSEILSQLSDSTIYPSCFICDEYHEYVTANDSSFLSQSREAKSINIVATQSYSSLLSAIKNETTLKMLIQNFVNKFWFRLDDNFTIDEIIKQLGKEEKEIISKSISENARQTNYNFLFNSFVSKDSNLSETINSSFQKDFVFDQNFFSRDLETFSCLAFISNGHSILPVQKLFLLPYFKERM